MTGEKFHHISEFKTMSCLGVKKHNLKKVSFFVFWRQNSFQLTKNPLKLTAYKKFTVNLLLTHVNSHW